MRKIGILGGTFDPIHNGHLAMGEYAGKTFSLDEIWFVPTGVPAYKEEIHAVTPAIHRCAMTKLAIKDYPFFRLSEIEVLRAGNTYTSDTLLQLRRENPETDFFYIIGSDSLDYIDRWHEPQVIFASAHILVVKRCTQTPEEIKEKKEFLLSRYGGQIDILEGDLIRISSTDIRRLVSKGESIAKLVPPEVEDYILEHGLYQDKVREGSDG